MRILDLTAIAMTLLLHGPTYPAAAQAPLEPLRTEVPPIIDGRLDDAVWGDATAVSDFTTWMPDFGQEMLGQTRALMAYDGGSLYFAFRCHDHDPAAVKASVTARDEIQPDDWICVHLDTFADQQSLYAFYVNPLGIQMDSRTAIGDEEDHSIDLVWYSEGRIDDQGYTVEMRIPCKSIRFRTGEPVEMGVLFERRISRTSEQGTFPGLDPRQDPSFFTQTRSLRYRNIEPYQLLEILPATTFSSRRALDQGELVSAGDRTDLSLTTKIGLASDLVLDGTYEPDFSQVEADAGQVDFNLRYALFLEEKRPFFLEGKELFGFGSSSMGDPLQAVVHTRTIVDPVIGAKLTGKVGEKNTFASIYARDELPAGSGRVEPAHVTILRYKRALSSDSFIGGFGTARELDDSGNRVIGADGQLRIDGSSRVEFHAFHSWSRDYRQSTRRNGHALGANYSYNNRDWNLGIRMQDLAAGFATETGFVTRTGVTRFHAIGSRLFYPRSSLLLRVDPLLVGSYTHDKANDAWEHSHAFYLGFTLPRSSRLRLGPSYRSEIYRREKDATSFIRLAFHGQMTKQFFLYLDYKYGKKIRYVVDPYPGRGRTAMATILYEPLSRFKSCLDVTYADFRAPGSDVAEFEYTIARFENRYQINRYVFVRAIVEYNRFNEELMTDLLASFTYIPGTVTHIGYGSRFGRERWEDGGYVDSDRFLEARRAFFFKAAYLWRR